jgi:hypothetical protein
LALQSAVPLPRKQQRLREYLIPAGFSPQRGKGEDLERLASVNVGR